MSDIRALAVAQAAITQTIAKEEMAEVSNANSLTDAADNALFNPRAIQAQFKTLKEQVQTTKTTEKGDAEKPEEEEVKAVSEVKGIESTAEDFQEKNPELQSRTLLSLKARISTKDSKEEILKKVMEAYPDCSLADEALDFLIETSNPELAEKLQEVKEEFNTTHKKEILAGKNIAAQTKEFAGKGLGSPTELRDLYRDVTQNPRDAATLFTELTNTYTFDKMKTVIAFIFHSLGSDLNSKGPSIEKGELFNLMTEAKSLQAILSVYRFFKSRMNLITRSYEREGLLLPSRVTFESLSKLFVKLLVDRYPAGEKIYQVGTALGIDDDMIAEVIIFTQMRDGIRNVSPRLFKSDQHRQDILTNFIDVLKELDDKIEELEENEEEDEEEEASEQI